MKTTFSIHYNTVWGESLSLVLQDKKYPMTWNEGGLWTVTLNASAAAAVTMYEVLRQRSGAKA